MFLATLMFPNRWAPTSSMVPLSRPAMDFTATSALLPSDARRTRVPPSNLPRLTTS